MAKSFFAVSLFFAVCLCVADGKELLCRQLADGKELADGKLADSSSVYIMMHGTVKMTSRSKISIKCAIKWSKMNNKSHGASNTSSMIHNIHAQERCHLEGVSLCILHNAEEVAKVV